MFEIKNVSKQYNGEFALKNISLTIGKGMNFIVGASGSGKTTLLKILNGMEHDFDGEVFFCGKNIKALSDSEKGYFYNHIFGFVWQDFHLMEERTVYENIMMPCYLNSTETRSAEKILKAMKIHDIGNKKVKLLSGGQKQRVAIARELMKNPQIIIADEPTSALDQKSAKTIIEILRNLSKDRTVIVVTHDTSLVTEKDRVIELDKGELVSAEEITVINKHSELKTDLPYRLPFTKVWQNTVIGAKRKPGHFVLAVFSLILAGILLMTAASSAIGNSGDAEFEKLLDTYGENILDIDIAGSFISGASTDENGKNGPNADVTQDISGLYEKYCTDNRVQFAVFSQAFNDISIKMDEKEYVIQSTGNVPVLTRLLSGKIPDGSENEVVVPETFVKQTGKTNDSILGETIQFNCSVVNWDSGEPVYKTAKISAVIVGVSNNSVSTEYEGKMYDYSVDDSFFFSKAALDEIRSQAEIKNESINFVLRAKTPADLIAIKDELNAKGIVPLGQFELVEDMVRLQTQTNQLSGGATMVISVLSLIAIIAISLTTSLLRKKEYAIYKISGYKTAHLLLINFCDIVLYALTAILSMLVTSPILNLITQNLLHYNLMSANILFTGVGLILLLAILYYMISILPCFGMNLSKELKVGEKA